MMADEQRIPVAGFTPFLSRLNLSGWTVDQRGHLFVVIRPKPGRISQLDYNTVMEYATGQFVAFSQKRLSPAELEKLMRDAWWIYPASTAVSPMKLTRRLIDRGPTRPGPTRPDFKELSRRPDVAGNLKRIRDQVRLAMAMAAKQIRDAKEIALRNDIREMASNAKVKYGFNKDLVSEILGQEAEMLLVEDVLHS